jgi:hypothetical protein
MKASPRLSRVSPIRASDPSISMHLICRGREICYTCAGLDALNLGRVSIPSEMTLEFLVRGRVLHPRELRFKLALLDKPGHK